MTTNGTNAKRAIKAHGGPALWPEAVIVGSKGINKCSDNAGSGGDFSFMDVENLHRRYSFDAQRWRSGATERSEGTEKRSFSGVPWIEGLAVVAIVVDVVEVEIEGQPELSGTTHDISV